MSIPRQGRMVYFMLKKDVRSTRYVEQRIVQCNVLRRLPLMKRRHFLATLPMASLLSCARNEKRAKRYDEHECPFCTAKKGVCMYCKGTKKCSFCGGTGKRTVVVPALPEKGILTTKYSEACPFCQGKQACTYCGGSGVCKTCKGSGRIENWDFLK